MTTGFDYRVNPIPLVFINRTGWYWAPVSPRSPATSATLGNGTLRLVPFWVPVPINVAAIGSEVTSAGDAASTLRLGVYAAGTDLAPLGAPLIDQTIAGDAIAVADVNLPATLTIYPGLYWIGAAVQGAASVQPTVRTVGETTVFGGFSAKPGAGGTSTGIQVGSVTGALPTLTTGTSIGNGASAPRCHLKIA